MIRRGIFSLFCVSKANILQSPTFCLLPWQINSSISIFLATDRHAYLANKHEKSILCLSIQNSTLQNCFSSSCSSIYRRHHSYMIHTTAKTKWQARQNENFYFTHFHFYSCWIFFDWVVRCLSIFEISLRTLQPKNLCQVFNVSSHFSTLALRLINQRFYECLSLVSYTLVSTRSCHLIYDY